MEEQLNALKEERKRKLDEFKQRVKAKQHAKKAGAVSAKLVAEASVDSVKSKETAASRSSDPQQEEAKLSRPPLYRRPEADTKAEERPPHHLNQSEFAKA